MKKVLVLIAMISLPLMTIGQTVTSDSIKQNDIMTFETIDIQQTITVLSTASKSEINDLSYNKSIELISIKAYRKSLQIKVKEIKTC